MSADSYIKFRKLTMQDGEPIEDILQRGADELRGLGEKASVELRLIGGADTIAKSIYSMLLTPAGASLHRERFTNPTLVVIMTSSVFHDIADGSYSPLQAYLDGKLKLQGNVELGRRIIQHLRASGTLSVACPHLTEVAWQLDPVPPGFEPVIGSLTLSGNNFTFGGTVEIVYDYGSGRYQQITTANSVGSFTVTQDALYCGDNAAGVGVIVYATDLSSGQYTTLNCSTPC